MTPVETGPAPDLRAAGIQCSGEPTLTPIEEEEPTAVVDGAIGVTWFLGTHAGVL